MSIPDRALYNGKPVRVLRYLQNNVFLVLDSSDETRAISAKLMTFLPNKKSEPQETIMSGIDLTFESNDDGTELNPFAKNPDEGFIEHSDREVD